MATPELRTELATDRLLLRRWKRSDLRPFAALNADPVVMEYFPAPLTRAESDAMVDRIERSFDQRGFGLWAVEVTATGVFAGFVGLWQPSFHAHFTLAVEIGWRLGRSHWGHGYATEAALAAALDGFERLKLGEVVSFTSAINRRSRRVMEKLGMTHNPAEDFEHPSLPPGDRLRYHVLYRMAAPSG